MPPTPVSVLTQHNNNSRTGANVQEAKLTTDNVNVNTFGKLFECPVDGQVYAQPLYVPKVRVTSGQGAVSTHNVLYVATMKNILYAFDADDGTKLWENHIDNKPPVPSRFFANEGYTDISDDDRRRVGILSTPVIDALIDPAGNNLTTGVLYLTLFTVDIDLATTDPNPDGHQFHYFLYAIDIGTGQKVPRPANPVEIRGMVPGNGYIGKTGAQVSTHMDGQVFIGGKPEPSKAEIQIKGKPVKIADGFTQAGKNHVRFNPMQYLQRPGLLFHDGTLFICFGAHGDQRPYHGWVFAYDAATLAFKDVICTTPNGGEAGVWQAAEGPVVDRNGHILIGTGNGDTVTPTSGSTGNLGESFIRLRFDKAAGKLGLTGFYNPFLDREVFQPTGHQPKPPGATLSRADDDDLGAASPTLLPDGNAVGGGKDGTFYLVDPTMFTLQPGNTSPALLQAFDASFGPGTPTVLQASQNGPSHHIHGSPVVYDSPNQGVLVYIWGENDVLRAYHYDPATKRFPGQPTQPGVLTTPTARGDVYASANVQTRNGMPGGILSISANGNKPGTAIVWGNYPPFENANFNVVGGALVAYDADGWDAADPANPPRLVAIWSSLQNPGRDRIHHAAPGDPNDQTQPQQFAKFCAPTIAAGKAYLPTFNRPRGAVYAYGKLPAADGGYNLGFGGAAGLALNGSAQVVGGHPADPDFRSIALTAPDRRLFQKGSVFAVQKQDVRKFKTSFEVTLKPDPAAPAGQPSADGFTFVVQGQGVRALGGPGAGLGFGPNAVDMDNKGYAIQNSVAVRFGLFQNGQPGSLTGVYTHGEFPSGGPTEQSTLTGGVDLHSGHRLRVQIRYDGAQLSWSIKDLVTNATFSATPFTLPLPAITGNDAFVGFTGATGGFTVQTVVHAGSWQFTAGSA